MQLRQTALLFALTSTLALCGCAANEPNFGKAFDSMNGKQGAVEARLNTAAAEAIAQGKTDEAVLHFKKIYSMDKDDAVAALNYAQVLRKTGKATDSVAVLTPFVKTKKGKTVAPILLNEYAATLIELGQLDEAEKILSSVLDNPSATTAHADAAHLMGVTLDAKGSHKDAEKMFRVALEGWNGDATSVMNNLALCLASQGLFDESLMTLRKALVMAPEKSEIARNIEIVSSLRAAVVPTAPLNIKK